MTMDPVKRNRILNRRTGITEAERTAIALKYNLLFIGDGMINPAYELNAEGVAQ